MSKHTPGPWFTTGTMTRYVEARIGSGAARLIQEVCSVGPTEADNGYGDQQEANARLIAAAPELLEALILMVRTHDEPAETLLQEVKEQQWLKKARAAIAKATGA